ncbi:MAG: hypothetical protein IJ877_08410 [Candidatus Gastranaerophilales bacterium]|nr:hypothetical protein [Candidatus Gastranaerophilales bacterium]
MMKKVISLFLICFFTVLPVNAKNLVKSNALVHTEYDILDDSENIIEFSPDKNIKISKNVDIPPHAKIKAQIIQSQKERRFHKSGFLICKLLDFTLEGVKVDISKYDAYLIARKYEPIDKKEAAIIATELVVMSGASFFAPGVDIGYFFTKGAILRKKHPNWFKAGVMNAYDNSICWIFLKGKPINLNKNDKVSLKHLTKEDAKDLSAKITYKKDKIAYKKEKKILISEVKEIKKEYNKEQKEEKHAYKIAQKQDRKILKEHQKMVHIMTKTLEKRAKIAAKSKKEK